jgi:hypothetical protein
MSTSETATVNNDESTEALYLKNKFVLSSFSSLSLFSEQKNFQSRPETYNGAERDRYSWTQTINDIDIRVKVKSLYSKRNIFILI